MSSNEIVQRKIINLSLAGVSVLLIFVTAFLQSSFRPQADSSDTVRLTSGANIQSAINNASSGTTIELANGTYDSFQFNKNGVKIIAPGKQAKITGHDRNGNTIRVTASNVILDGIIVENAPSTGIFVVQTDHVIIRNCKVNHNGYGDSGPGSDGILYAESSYGLVENCELANNQSHGLYFGAAPSHHMTARNNYIHNNKTIQLHINAEYNSRSGSASMGDILAEGNRIGDGDHGGIDLCGIQNSTFRNNVIYHHPNKEAISLWNEGGACIKPSGNKFYHNTIIQSGNATIVYNGVGSNNIWKNNIILGGRNDASNDGGNIFSGDTAALFVNVSSNDYHLKSGSAAINKGVAVEGVPTDIEGRNRDSQPDAGAYEFGSSNPPVTPPPGTPIPTPTPINNGSTITLRSGNDITAAVNQAQSGTTILLEAGEYRPFSINKSNVTIQAKELDRYLQSKTNPWDQGNVSLLPHISNGQDGIFTEKSNIRLKGLHVSGVRRNGLWVNGGSNVSLENSVFHDICCVAEGKSQGVLFGGPNNSVIGNYMYDIRGEKAHTIYFGGSSADSGRIANNHLFVNIWINGEDCESGDGIIRGMTIENNILEDKGDRAVNRIGLASVQDSTIRNNIIYNNDRGITAEKASCSRGSSSNLKIYNNTIIAKGGHAIDMGQSNNVQLKNNILLGPIRGSISQQSNNITSGSEDTLLINARGGDYHLKPAATAAINQGVALSEVTTDFEGTTRPQGSGYDIGADEFGNGIPITPSPYPSITPTLAPSGGVELTLSINPKVLRAGEQGVLTLTYRNTGSRTAGSAKLTQSLPAGFTTQDGQSAITLLLGNLAPNASGTKTINIKRR